MMLASRKAASLFLSHTVQYHVEHRPSLGPLSRSERATQLHKHKASPALKQNRTAFRNLITPLLTPYNSGHRHHGRQQQVLGLQLWRKFWRRIEHNWHRHRLRTLRQHYDEHKHDLIRRRPLWQQQHFNSICNGWTIWCIDIRKQQRDEHTRRRTFWRSTDISAIDGRDTSDINVWIKCAGRSGCEEERAWRQSVW